MGENVVYAGRDLEAMSFAHNYHKWILEVFSPYLGTRIVEVGAGRGSFSELILSRSPESVSLVEPSADMHRLLVQRIKSLHTTVRIQIYNALFRSVAEQIRSQQQPDSMIYVNVLEHIEDDLGELEAASQTLAIGGRLFLFVPALKSLYGSFDRQVGHYRRYERAELNDKCERTGFRVLKSSYFDLAGIATWWLKYCILRSDKMEPGAVRLYDKIAVPPLRRIESLVAPPIGKNILIVAEKVRAD
jgi:phospholipid N-methyltransferase